MPGVIRRGRVNAQPIVAAVVGAAPTAAAIVKTKRSAVVRQPGKTGVPTARAAKTSKTSKGAR